MTDQIAASTRTQWRILYENDNPHRERTNADRVTEVAQGRFRHELTAAERALVNYERLAEACGATIIGIQQRSVVTTYGPWEDAATCGKGHEEPCRDGS